MAFSEFPSGGFTVSYWDTTRRRLSRRAALGTLGAIGTGVAGVAAGCASPAPTPTAAPAAASAPPRAGAAQPTAPPAATAVPAKYGGTIRTSRTGIAPHYDPHISTSSPSAAFGFGIAYSRLIKYKLGPDVKFPAFIPTGDLAESWQQADETTLTLKLRPNVKWHNIPPVNGRTFTAEDAVYSITRMKTPGYPTAPLMDSTGPKPSTRSPCACGSRTPTPTCWSASAA
jgi:peptide/nickel transport system substrate-binding protein